MKKTIIASIAICVALISCNKNPEACFVADKGKNAKLNEQVQFDASCTEGADSYTWSFGDGTQPEMGKIVNHKFLSSGTFIVALTAKKGNKNGLYTAEIIIEP